MAHLRIYFATDVHASERCWKKFLAAPAFYGADVAIMGGDLTGKVIVPLVHRSDGTVSASFNGLRRSVRNGADLAKLKAQIADSGAYAYECDEDEVSDGDDYDDRMQAQFGRLALAQVQRWVDMAEDRLAGTGVRCLVKAGNDDAPDVDDVLGRSEVVELSDGRVIELDDSVVVLGLGYANITPWRCPRDITEEQLAEKIAALVAQVPDPRRAIFDIHVPPYDSGLDTAPLLDDDLNMVMGAHGPVTGPVGSTAVREAIETHSPLLTLHGHVHESRNVRKLGATTMVNPGSEYREGILNGALIDLDTSSGRSSVQLVSG